MDDLKWFSNVPSRYLIAKDISSTQKLLIGLISGLSNIKGYCFASNEYFSDLLSVNKATISQAISDLEKKEYITRVIYRNEKQQVEQRILMLRLDKFSDIPLPEKLNTLPKKNYIPPSKNLKDNSKNNNKINNNNNKDKELLFFSSEWELLWNLWIQYKKEEHNDKFKSKNTEQVAVNHLVKLSNKDIDIAKEIVNYSIANKYKGLFELKKSINTKPNDKLTQYQEWYADIIDNHENPRSQELPEIKKLGF